MLGVKLGSSPTPVPGCTGPDALNIGPEEAAHAYRERAIGPMRGILPAAALRSMEDELSGSCIVEIAAFDEFTALIGNSESARAYDHVIFDAAPTGHTLRLMSLAKLGINSWRPTRAGTPASAPSRVLRSKRRSTRRP